MDDKGLSRQAGAGLFRSQEASNASAATAAVHDVAAELRAWQDRCILVEAALAAANEVLQRELPGWQQRCAAVEAALAAATDRMHRELPEWERRCAVTEEALAEANKLLADEIPRWRERCELAENALISLEESKRRLLNSPIDSSVFLAFASKFRPARAVGMPKRRIGAAADGGYVMLDDLAHPLIALSLGVGDDTSWDRQMADLGVIIHQYDHTVQAPRGQPSSIVFNQKRIVDIPDGTGVTLEHALSILAIGHVDHSAILKIDIEGNEWSVLDAAPDGVLQRFDQIICEYHDLDRATDPLWLKRASRVMSKLNEYFQVIHVHGNNNGQFAVIGGIPFPSVIEVTHVNRSRYRLEPTQEKFPTELDYPNHPGRPDLWLGTFCFETDSQSFNSN